MERQILLQYLALADRHIAEGEERLAKQEGLVAELDHDGHDTKEARLILTTMRRTQALHREDRARILRGLER